MGILFLLINLGAYRDKIRNLEGYIFEKFFNIEKLWDGLSFFLEITETSLANNFIQG